MLGTVVYGMDSKKKLMENKMKSVWYKLNVNLVIKMM